MVITRLGVSVSHVFVSDTIVKQNSITVKQFADGILDDVVRSLHSGLIDVRFSAPCAVTSDMSVVNRHMNVPHYHL
ncbi:hypothetical protein SprV_0100312400 [Sparganum proliferum]